jgi:hypothetical protein
MMVMHGMRTNTWLNNLLHAVRCAEKTVAAPGGNEGDQGIAGSTVEFSTVSVK